MHGGHSVEYSAERVASMLGLPEPTAQQQSVIEAPLAPTLVVAGAGSGKTETMANRIVWLLANGMIDVTEILGLTFTRKAAGELHERVVKRIDQLGVSVRGAADVLATPTVSTYHSFAGGIYREYARSIGREPDATVITEATAWRLVRDIVVRRNDPMLVDLDQSVESITEAVLGLAHEMSDNAVTDVGGDVARFAETFGGIASLPIDAPRKRTDFESVRRATGVVRSLPLLVSMAEEFQIEKRQRGLVEFSDQVSLAQQIVDSVPRVRADYRARYRAVILDEYQDTSVLQTRLLSTLFQDCAVMAVGDPNQSIYGWRGASSSNIARFASDFSSSGRAESFSLSVSWRNSRDILSAANAVMAGLPALPSVPVAPLEAAPQASTGTVLVDFSETVAEEAERVATWFVEQLAEPAKNGGVRTAALLCRSVKRAKPFTDALRAAGVRVHVLGLIGLLEHPAIVDTISTLRVMHDPTAGADLVRLLAGARWRVGVADIDALAGTAVWLSRRDAAQQLLSDETRRVLSASTSADDGASLVDALDATLTMPDDHVALREISHTGLSRIRELALLVQRLRRRATTSLVDTVTGVMSELRIDIEVDSNETDLTGRESIDAFIRVVESFVLTAEQPTLGPLLSWLEDAARRERLTPATEPAEPGTVQVVTIHGAKGLEWDSVAVPRVVADEFPSALLAGESNGWLRFGGLPYEFVGDREDRPALNWRVVDSQRAFDEELTRFKVALHDRNAEEQRRLAYVAITRARDGLLLSGSFWSTQKRPRPPSVFLTEVARVLSQSERLRQESIHTEHPDPSGGRGIVWPLDPLGDRRHVVETAAELVKAQRPGAESPWSDDIRLLLAERDARRVSAEGVAVPGRIAASRFQDFVLDPEGTALALRRPVPERPYRQTRVGTLFHSWVEARFEASRAGIGEMLNVTPIEDDRDPADAASDGAVDEADRNELERLKRIFEASEWAQREPLHVELELNVTFDGRVLICKLDAVYERDGRIQIVDWKTGRRPTDARQLRERQLQLALYRYAYATWAGIDSDEIDVVFYYVSEDAVVRPEVIDSEEELLARWRTAIGSAPV